MPTSSRSRAAITGALIQCIISMIINIWAYGKGKGKAAIFLAALKKINYNSPNSKTAKNNSLRACLTYKLFLLNARQLVNNTKSLLTQYIRHLLPRQPMKSSKKRLRSTLCQPQLNSLISGVFLLPACLMKNLAKKRSRK